MWHNLKGLYGHSIAASDDTLGHVKDFYFDDHTWVVRYVIVDTGNWLTGRAVLLSPHAFGHLAPTDGSLRVNLTRRQIESSPSIDSHKPVSRQYESEYFSYYGWPNYWMGGAIWGFTGFPLVVAPSTEDLDAMEKRHESDDPHLRSTRAVTGYHIETTDGTVGHVSGFLVDDQSWAIRELVVETGHWYSGKEILIAPAKIQRISHEESKVFVNLTMADLERTKAHHVVKSGGAHQGAASFPTE